METKARQAAMAEVRALNEKYGSPRRVYVLTFGCQQNEADSEKLRGMCREMGYLDAARPEDASLILVNTCAVREHAEKRALSLIGSFKHIREKDPSVVIGVCGCMAAKPDRVEEFRRRYPYVRFTMRPSDLDRLPDVLLAALRGGKRQFLLGDDTPEIAEDVPVVRAYRHRAFVTVMTGCNNFCSYCIVPHVRGRERSRDADAVVREVQALIADGCRDVTLLGQNVNSYRSGCDFTTLLYRLDAIPGDYVLRFMSSHPKDVPDSLIEAMGKCRHVESHFHLPVQAGSDKVLREMNRHYTAESYLAIVDKLRASRPGIVLTSDVMVGFPGETEEDFLQTLELLRRAQFDMVYSFIYSPRPGTPAALREDQVPDNVKSERMRRLLETQDAIALASNEKDVGQTFRVLVDGMDKKGARVTGRTDGGKLVHFAAKDAQIGDFCLVKIEKAEPYALIGSPVSGKESETNE